MGGAFASYLTGKALLDVPPQFGRNLFETRVDDLCCERRFAKVDFEEELISPQAPLGFRVETERNHLLL